MESRSVRISEESGSKKAKKIKKDKKEKKAKKGNKNKKEKKHRKRDRYGGEALGTDLSSRAALLAHYGDASSNKQFNSQTSRTKSKSSSSSGNILIHDQDHDHKWRGAGDSSGSESSGSDASTPVVVSTRGRFDSDEEEKQATSKAHKKEQQRKWSHACDKDGSVSDILVPRRRTRLDSGSSDGSAVGKAAKLGHKRVDSSDDSDISVPRKLRAHTDSCDDSDISVPRKPRARVDSSDDSDISVPRKLRAHTDSCDDSDISVPRKPRARVDSSDSDISVPRKARARADSSDSDVSVPRKAHSNANSSNSDISHLRKRARVDSLDSDISILRNKSKTVNKAGSDSSDSNFSVHRKERVRAVSTSSRTSSASSAVDVPRMECGVRAGLRDSASFAKERAALAEKKNIALADADRIERLEGRGAGTVYRDKQGHKVDMVSELRQAQISAAADAVDKERLKLEWGLGSVDKAKLRERQEELEEAAGRTFAVYADNEKLNEELKAELRADDPMAAFIAKKQATKQQQAGGDNAISKIYLGPPPPPNRFGIKPDYRWDGVDRSNGFERRLLASKAASASSSEQKYRLLSSDM